MTWLEIATAVAFGVFFGGVCFMSVIWGFNYLMKRPAIRDEDVPYGVYAAIALPCMFMAGALFAYGSPS